MSHQVLARKWRPRTFDTLVGQDHVVRALDHALQTGRLHHAYLFTGTRGVGKTTIARILAKAVNCEKGMSPTPCGECGACTEIDVGRFVDYLELDAASNRGVDEMAQLLDNAVYAPTAGRYKVYVIDEVHMLTAHAFNAMLKTLEEPPPHVLFILATTDPQKVPVTVLSRCMQLNLRNMRAPAIAAHLQTVLTAEEVEFEESALPMIGRAAAGSMRDALSLLDQAIAYGAGQVRQDQVRDMLGTIDADHLERVFAALAEQNTAELVAIADEVADQNTGADSLLSELAQAVSEMAVAALEQSAPEQSSLASRWSQAFSAHDLQVFYQILIYARRDLPLAPDVRSGLAMALLRLAAFTVGDVPGATSNGRGGLPVGQAPAAERSAGVPPAPAAMPAEVKSADPAPAAAALSPAAAARAALAGRTETSQRPHAGGVVAADGGQGPASADAPAGRRSSALRAALAASGAKARPAALVAEPAKSPDAADSDTAQTSDAKVAAVEPVRRRESPPDAPQDGGQDERWLDEEVANSPRPALPDVTSAPEIQMAPAAASAQSPMAANVQFAGDPFDWPALAKSLSLGGRLGQFMQQSECISASEHQFSLRVPIAPLADASVVDKARQAVSEYLGREITLDVTVGVIEGDTAVGRDHADQQVRLAQARETIEADPFVRTLLDEFDGQIVPDSIRALDSEPTQQLR